MGGSGKQSLTRLAAYVSGLEVFQIQLRKGYSIADLKVGTLPCTALALLASGQNVDCLSYVRNHMCTHPSDHVLLKCVAGYHTLVLSMFGWCWGN